MKISKNMLDYICSSSRVCDMFLDFKNNKEYFDEGSYEEYYDALKSHLVTYFEKDINESAYRMQKDRILCTKKLYGLFSKEKGFDISKDGIFNALRKYKDMINILVIEKQKPFALENLDMRSSALSYADINIRDIDSFFKEYDYENVILKKLKEYDEYINSNKNIGKKKFKEFNELLSYASIDIPSDYIDLYFKCLINGYETNYDAVYNVSRSMICNLAKEKDTTCLFNVDKLKYDAGIYHDGIITISNSQLKSLVKSPKKNVGDYLETLFHEFTHLVQYTNYRQDRAFSYNEIKMLEDQLLVETLNSKYGRNNYKNLSYELDAREMSRIMVYRYFGLLGIKVNKNIIKENKLDSDKSKSDLRQVTDFKMVPVDHLFDEFIASIISVHRGDYLEDIFTTYPILNLMYSKDGKRYTILDLLKMREEIISRLLESVNLDSDINKISNINEIIYNRDLSFVNLVADYKELMLDTSLDIGQEKTKIKKALYKKIKSIDTQTKFIDFTMYVNSLIEKDRITSEEIDTIIKTGEEMADYFFKIKDDIIANSLKLKNVPNKRQNN